MARPRKKKGRTEKGLGSLTKVGRYFHFRIKVDGVTHRHPTQKETLDEAKVERDRFLKKFRDPATVAASDKPIHDTVTVAELIDDYMTWKRLDAKDEKARYNVDADEQRLQKHIVGAFGTRRAASITTNDLMEYRETRKNDPTKTNPPADATINWELARMRSAFYHGHDKQTPKKVLDVPWFPIVELDNIRQGFIEFEEYKTILDSLPDSIKLFFILAFHVGCRSGELTDLKWKQVNLRLGHIELKKTKNGKDRHAPLYGDMRDALLQQLEVRKAECPNCDYVLFWHQVDIDTTIRKIVGDKLNDFRKSWKRAVKVAGHDGLLPHDLRRTASRNMVEECGLTESQAMLITGHLTNSQFKRYNIVSAKSIKESGVKMDAWFRQRMAEVALEAATATVAALEPAPPTMKQRVRALFVQGLSHAEISKELGIQTNTVQYHISDSVKAATLERNRGHKRQARSAA